MLANLILNFIVRFLPVPLADRFLNNSLPSTASQFKRFCRTDPALFDHFSKRKILYMFRRTVRKVPAYAGFLKDAGLDPGSVKYADDLDRLVPSTSKENYIWRFPLEERCIGGKYPGYGSVEESSGTTGKPTFWIRSDEEEQNNMRLTRATMNHLFGTGCDGKLVIVNGFASGGWSGGLRFSSRIGSLGMIKQTGPDPQKIIRTLSELGTDHTYLIGGYPPFIATLIDYGSKSEMFSWKDFNVHILTGGEGFPEKWRECIASCLKDGAQIYSVYGAIDLDVAISVETPLTILLRKLTLDDPVLRRAIFSSDINPVFVGQVSNQKFYVRQTPGTNGSSELEITVMSLQSAAPLLKYAIRDEGGIMGFSEFISVLRKHGYPPDKIAEVYNISEIVPFPVMWIYGRSDGTVTINGSLISPCEVEESILSDNLLFSSIGTFRLSVEPDAENTIRLYIFLEARQNIEITEALLAKAQETILAGLVKSNECFRNSFDRDPQLFRPVISIFPYRTGIFSDQDERIKNIYIK